MAEGNSALYSLIAHMAYQATFDRQGHSDSVHISNQPGTTQIANNQDTGSLVQQLHQNYSG